MPESEQNKQNEFLIEKIKERPVNRKKLLRRTIITAAMAVIFGLIACFTFLILEPVISNWLYPEEEPQVVVFPEDQEEMSPEEMLSNNMQAEIEEEKPQEEVTLDEEQIQEQMQEQMQKLLADMVLDIEDYHQMYSALADYTTELNERMVRVTGVSSDVDWFNNVLESKNQSSGVIVAENGLELLVLVDYAPIQDAEELILTFYNELQVQAKVKQFDTVTGLAVLAVNLSDIDKEYRENIKIASLGSSNMKNIVGTPVIALGSPMGSSGSICYGMITSAGSQFAAVDANYKMLTTDIYGSSQASGVLFNLKGDVVGIIARNYSNSDMKNILTAYGISDLRAIMTKMSNGSPMAYLGITGIDVTQEANTDYQMPYGAYVKEVEMDSPAMLAGIQQGDVITNMNGYPILKFSEYTASLMKMEVGQTVEVTVMRQVQEEFKEMSFEITLGELGE